MPTAKAWTRVIILAFCAVGVSSHALATEFPEEGSFATGITISGTSAGILARYHSSESFAMILGATYSQFSREDISETPSQYSSNTNDDWRLSLSPAARFYFANNGPLWFSEVGVTLGYVNDDFEYYFDSTNGTPTERYTKLSGWEYGFAVAAGLEHFIAEHVSVEGKFGLSTRYSDLSGDEEDSGTTSVTTTSSSFFSNVAINFYW